jgi:hypothetical protein
MNGASAPDCDATSGSLNLALAALIPLHLPDDPLRVALRGHPNHYVPVLFDFDLPTGKHILETVALLARLARFVIADITDPSMVRAELVLIAPTLPSVPIQPLQMKSATPMAEFPFLEEYPGCCRSIAIRIFRTCLRRLTT